VKDGERERDGKGSGLDLKKGPSLRGREARSEKLGRGRNAAIFLHSAGCVVASCLAQNTRYSVLLVKAGPDYGPSEHVPSAVRDARCEAGANAKVVRNLRC
jgi:hypothetical protein